MALDPRLQQLLESWEDLRDAGQAPTPEAHCGDCPELLEPFRRLLRRSEGSPGDSRSTARDSIAVATSPEVCFRVSGDPLRGGMGEVFSAWDGGLRRTVALKFIQRGKDSVEAERRFRREAAITARLQHPGIVPVYGPALSEDGRAGYAMRFIVGESFDYTIDRHHSVDPNVTPKPTRAELLDRFEAICNAVAYAHSHDIIHRDLKPANVMLGKFGETFVVDWGLAKILEDDSDDDEDEERTVDENKAVNTSAMIPRARHSPRREWRSAPTPTCRRNRHMEIEGI